MKATIRKMGNSQGVLIPKPILEQIGLHGEAEMSVENGTLVLRKPSSPVREGWADFSKAIAASGDDKQVWPEFANKNDKDLVW